MGRKLSSAAAIFAAALPLAGAAFAHEHGKPAPAARPHMDHTPKHGGIFFMAPDGFHHLEGTYERPGIVRVYMYDNYSVPIRANGFTGDVSLGDSPGSASVPLVEAADGTLVATFPVDDFPATIDVWIDFPAKDEMPPSREVFTFAFEGFSDATVPGTSKPHCDPN